LEKSKFHKDKEKANDSQLGTQGSHSYAQASRTNIKDIIKIKDNFPKLSTKKIEEVHKVFNKFKKNKPRFNIITKELSRKQIIVPMSSNNSEKFMVLFNRHVANINRASKNIKLDIMTNFIRADNIRLTITTNKVISTLDLNTIENYIKNIDVINLNNVILPKLSQSKLYLKILGISYFVKDTNALITANIVKRML